MKSKQGNFYEKSIGISHFRNKMHRFGIVGCGLTGAVTAMLLKQRLPNVNITILEKSKGSGKFYSSFAYFLNKLVNT